MLKDKRRFMTIRQNDLYFKKKVLTISNLLLYIPFDYLGSAWFTPRFMKGYSSIFLVASRLKQLVHTNTRVRTFS